MPSGTRRRDLAATANRLSRSYSESMIVFFVHFSDGPLDELKARITERYPKTQHYQLSKNTYLVRDHSICEQVAHNIGICGPTRVDGTTGIVHRLGRRVGYSGFYDRSVWEWLDLAAAA